MTSTPFDDEIAALLAEQTVTEPPPALRSGTLARALSARRPGRPVDAARPCEPAVAFDRTVADLSDLLGSLSADEWNAPAHADHGRVRDVTAHLAGVEELVARWLASGDLVPELPDHVAATRDVVAGFSGTDPREVTRRWHDGARAVAAAAVGDGSRMVVFHDLIITVDQLLMTRTGELWGHAIDICRATGRPLPRLDSERMATLCAELMGAVPLALAYRGTLAPGCAARFVLTGPAGGTFTVPLALEDPPADPQVTIVADAVDLCQVAVRRLRPDQLDAAIDGDRELADFVLGSIDALAKD
jgi:uncharacterized protein (TIGR03083 family)